MEFAPSEDIFNHPHHPYTISLLSAILDPDPDKKWHVNLSDGRIADSDGVPEGCKYQDRCSIAETACRKEEMVFEKVGENHFVRCWKAAKNI
jgi:oligopeptide/dipeptide ABC transporter ATP-binding protein